MENTFSFKIEKDGNEFHAWCPELSGCHTHGKTQKEALDNLRDAIHLYLDVVFDQMMEKQAQEVLN